MRIKLEVYIKMLKKIDNIYKWVKSRVPHLVFYSVLLFGFNQVGAVLNFITNLFLVPKYLTPHELGLIAPVTQYVALGTLPLSIIAFFVIKFITRYEANNEWGKLKTLVRDMFLFGGGTTLVVAIVFIAGYNSFALRMGIESNTILLLMLAHLCVSSCLPVMVLLTRSMQRYFLIAICGFCVPFTLFICALFLLPHYGLTGYLIALIASITVNLIAYLFAVHKYFAPHDCKMEPYFNECKVVLRKYLSLFVLASGANWLWGFVPPFVVKHFLSDLDAAGFYFVQRLAALPTYLVAPLLMILLPYVSLKYEKKQETAQTVKRSIIFTVVSGGIIVITLYLFCDVLFRVMPNWQPYEVYAKYIWVMAVSLILGQVNSIIGIDFSSRWFFSQAWYRLPVNYGLVAVFYCVFGWGAFKGIIPDLLWNFIEENLPRGILLILCILILRQVLMLLFSMYWYWRIWRGDDIIPKCNEI